MTWRLAAAALLALLLGSVSSLAQTPPTIVGPVTVGNCVAFFSPVQIKDAGVVCGGAAGAVQSVGNFASDTSLTIAGVGTGPWNGAVTIKLTTPVTLANGGTNNSALAASNGGIVWSDATKLNVLAGTVTAGQCLLSGSSAAPSWGACGGGGGAVSSVSNADGTLTISPTTGAVVASINLAHANTWTALQKHILSGTGILISNNAAATALTNQGIDVAEDGAPGSITITTYGIVGATNMPTFVGQTARGSLASPAVVQANDVLASFSGRGYIGSGFAAAGRGFVRFFASELWSTTANGTYISFATTASGTTTTAEALRIENDGGMTVPATVTGGDKGAGSINVSSLYIGGTLVALPITLANGGTSNGLTASAGGIVWSDASKLNILAGTSTSGQCLLSGNLAAPSWGACAGGGAVSSVTNSDGTLTISPTTGAVVASIALGHANTWTGVQTFSASGIKLLGSSTGATTFTSANAGASAFTLTFPAATDQLVGRATTDTLTNKTFNTAATGNVFQINGTTITAISGNTGTVATTTGTLTSTHCVNIDASGNLKDAGAACGTGGGTPGGTSGQIQYNNASAFGGFGFTDGSAITALGNSTTAQAFRVYNTVDTLSGPTNYERGVFDWTTTANRLSIGVQAGGTGTMRRLDFYASSGGYLWVGNGNNWMQLNGDIHIDSGATFGWVPAGDATVLLDTALARDAAGVMSVNSGAVAGTPGGIKAANFIHGGAVPVDGGGSCLASSFAGGATAGTFNAAVCAAGTIAITFAFTAPNGWSCDAEDRTTISTGKLQQTASTTTKATFTATTTASDVIQYKCSAY